MLGLKLRLKHFAKYRDKRLQEVTPSKVLKELGPLKHALDTAQKEWGFNTSINPLNGIRRSPGISQRDRRLDSNELERLLILWGKTANHLFEPLVAIAIETGTRRGELLGLLWQNVDLDKRTAFLPLTKNGTSRTIPLSLRR